jgi:3-dehydroquinate synthetase
VRLGQLERQERTIPIRVESRVRWIANKQGWLTKAELSDIQSFIVQIFGKVELPADKSGIIQLTLQDKKNVGDKIQIAVPKGIGNNIWDIPVTVEEVKGGLDYYES